MTYSFDCDGDSSFEVGPQSSNTTSCSYGDDGIFIVNVLVEYGGEGCGDHYGKQHFDECLACAHAYANFYGYLYANSEGDPHRYGAVAVLLRRSLPKSDISVSMPIQMGWVC